MYTAENSKACSNMGVCDRCEHERRPCASLACTSSGMELCITVGGVNMDASEFGLSAISSLVKLIGGALLEWGADR